MNIQNITAKADEFTCNVYLLDGDVLIDTGSDDAEDVILDELEDENIDTVVITHSHWDHIENVEDLREQFDVDIYAYNPDNVPGHCKTLGDGDVITLAGHDFEAIHTPGHKDDHLCLYNEDEGVLFTGDLVFAGSGFGRTDLDEGDRGTLINSIEKLVELDVSVFYPGHGEAVTENANEAIKGSLKHAEKRKPKY